MDKVAGVIGKDNKEVIKWPISVPHEVFALLSFCSLAMGTSDPLALQATDTSVHVIHDSWKQSRIFRRLDIIPPFGTLRTITTAPEKTIDVISKKKRGALEIKCFVEVCAGSEGIT